MIENIIIILIISSIICAAVYHVYNTKKKGHKCIGCPYAKQCTKKHVNQMTKNKTQ